MDVVNVECCRTNGQLPPQRNKQITSPSSLLGPHPLYPSNPTACLICFQTRCFRSLKGFLARLYHWLRPFCSFSATRQTSRSCLPRITLLLGMHTEPSGSFQVELFCCRVYSLGGSRSGVVIDQILIVCDAWFSARWRNFSVASCKQLMP